MNQITNKIGKFSFIIFFIFPIICKLHKNESNRRKLTSDNYIKMTVKGEGFLTILKVQKEYKPSTISLDGISNSDNIVEAERNSSNIVYYLKASTDEEYAIIISWNILKDAFEMFYSCHDIVFFRFKSFICIIDF